MKYPNIRMELQRIVQPQIMELPLSIRQLSVRATDRLSSGNNDALFIIGLRVIVHATRTGQSNGPK